MKKIVCTAVCILLLLPAMLFAAGQREEVDPGVQEITFMHVFTGARAELVDDIVNSFNESQDGIVVSHQHATGWYGGLLEQLQTLAVARQMPEVAIMGLSESITMRRELGAVSVQSYIDRDDYELDVFFDQFLDLGRDISTGEQFALPYAISTPLIFVNRDLLKEAGLDPHYQPQTWMELKEWAREVNNIGPDISGIGFQLDFDTWQFQVLTESFGGSIADISTRRVMFNEEPGVRALNYWLTMMHEDESYPNISGGEAADNFINGKLGIIMATTGNYGAFTSEADFDLGILLLPEYDDFERQNPRRVAAGGSNIFILPSTEAKQNAAWEFIKFTLNDESSRKILDMGYMVARKELEDPDIRAYEMIDDIVNWYNWPSQGARITDYKLNNIYAAFNQEMTAEEALDDAAAEAKRILGW